MQNWTCLFLVLCGMQSVCHCCDWIRNHYLTLSGEYLSLLDNLGGDITKQDVPVPFPNILYRRIDNAKFEDKVRFLNETIYEITKLFNEDLDAVTWNKKNLDDFLNILHRQFKNLKSCVSPASKPQRRLKRYFKRLNTKVLNKMNYSAPAWELIRKETRYHLQRLDLLVANMH